MVLKAQESEEATSYNNEFGLNVTGFANQFFSFNGNEAPQGPYLFTFKKLDGDKAFRMGLGANVVTRSGEDGNSVVPFNESILNLDLRLGAEKHHDISNRWLFTTGFDGLLSVAHSKFESSNNFNDSEQKSTSFLLGLGPVVGVHFRINERISIGTESTLYLSYTYTKRSFDSGFPGSDDSDKNSAINLNIAPPFALYFSIRI